MADGENGRRTAVSVSVAVAGGDEHETAGLPQRIQRAVDGATAQRGGVVARNDIANVLEWIVRFVGADSGLGRLLQSIADWFDDLDPDGTKPWSAASIILALDEFSRSPRAQALPGWINAECFQALLTNARADVQEAGLMLANKVPQRLQEFLNCLLATDPQARALVSQAEAQFGITIDPEKVGKCLFNAVMQYITTKNPWGAVGSFFSCMLTSNGGGGAQVEHETVKRC